MKQTVRVHELRTREPGAPSRWESFDVACLPNMNVITLLLEIRKHPVTRQGQPTEPVVWECNCLEEVCGACSMVINSLPRQACSTLVKDLSEPVRLQPLTKFPVVRDLMVDRSVMFEHLKRVKAWIAIDGTHDLGHGPKMSKEEAAAGYQLSRCMTCGCCMEGCPQVNARTGFIGPAAIAQARLFNIHKTGKMWEDDRLAAIMRDGGINECGNAQNCERVCPKRIPLLASLAEMNRKTIGTFFRNLLRR